MKFIPNDDNFVLLAAEGNYKIKLLMITFLSTQTDLINCILSSKTPFVFPITRKRVTGANFSFHPLPPI